MEVVKLYRQETRPLPGLVYITLGPASWKTRAAADECQQNFIEQKLKFSKIAAKFEKVSRVAAGEEVDLLSRGPTVALPP